MWCQFRHRVCTVKIYTVDNVIIRINISLRTVLPLKSLIHVIIIIHNLIL